MKETRKTVALIYGGRGYESEVSLRGAGNIRPIIEEKYNCLPVFIDKEGRWLTEGKELFPANIGGKGGFFCPKSGEFFAVDCAFPLLHGDFGEDGVVQGSLECASVPYVGCDVSGGAVCRDKAFLKAEAKELNIPTLPYLLAIKGEGDIAERAEREIGYPMFVKPARLGSSIGARSARDGCELLEALSNAFSLCDRVIIEPLLNSKRELECGYFGACGLEIFTSVGEIICQGFYDYESKYEHRGGVHVSAVAEVDDRVNRKIKEYSKRLVRFLGIRSLSRIDFFLSEDEIYFNEINTMPGFTGGSLYARLISAEGISEDKLIELLIEDALS